MAPFLFVDKIYRGEKIKQFGDGSSQRDYTFVADIVQGVLGAIDSWKTYPGTKGVPIFDNESQPPIVYQCFMCDRALVLFHIQVHQQRVEFVC